MGFRVIKIPFYCPVRDPELEVVIDECECLGTAGTGQNGESGMCIGRIRKHRMVVEGYVHENDHAFCLYNPNAFDKEFVICMHILNRNDFELLHGLFHCALAMRGFLKV